jgi:hypothetical protein
MRTTYKPVIYLAGKISKHGWRETIVPEIDRALDDAHDLFDAQFVLEYETFIYGGPFFVNCDHGCGHGPASHGVDAAADNYCGAAFIPGITPRRVFEVNRRRVANADHVFAFINEVDCYGALIEIGVASELGKHITVVFGPDLSTRDCRDLWMARECDDKVYRGSCATPGPYS